MQGLKSCVDSLVSAGIRAYIELLGTGERVRSKRLFKDTLEMSALVSGGPSAVVHPLFTSRWSTGEQEWRAGDRPLLTCMLLVTLRSLLATLLVLKVSPYWSKIPVLEELRHRCNDLAVLLQEDDSGRASGRTAVPLNVVPPDETGAAAGGRRSNALPALPELVGPRV